ncbi:MAG: hypothetical protein EBQ73_10290, partial [Gammaproteobacteria bacterium]|nr:hypothetical protein [Gammaproteobacteria bacterium]
MAPKDDINVTGVETYPLGGGVPAYPRVFGLTSGTGQFVGVDGVVNISYDPTTQFFTYVFTLIALKKLKLSVNLG